MGNKSKRLKENKEPETIKVNHQADSVPSIKHLTLYSSPLLFL